MICAAFLSGCGTTVSRDGTEQLLASNAVDQAVARINFRALSGKKVYLDTQFIKTVKGIGFVNADYIISSLRQQLVAANCRLQESADKAEYIVEARVGALGGNGHEVSYGIPASNALSTAAAVVPTLPAIPTIPEMSLAKKNDQSATAKISVFAYHRETRQPIWQSGASVAESTAKDTWVFGIGPFQSGTIYESTQFAGDRIDLPLLTGKHHDDHRSIVPYDQEYYFAQQEEDDAAAGKVAQDEPASEEAGEGDAVAADEPQDGQPKAEEKPAIQPVGGTAAEAEKASKEQAAPAVQQPATPPPARLPAGVPSAQSQRLPDAKPDRPRRWFRLPSLWSWFRKSEPAPPQRLHRETRRPATRLPESASQPLSWTESRPGNYGGARSGRATVSGR